MLAGYATGIVPYLRDRLDVARCRELIALGHARRADTFLVLLERAVYGNAGSPYLPLLSHAGIEYGDVARLVRQDGVESALADLYDAGVRVSIDEWKGRSPIRRAGIELPFTHVRATNPLVAGRFEAISGGTSGGEPRPVVVNFPFLTQLTMYHGSFLDAFGVGARPTALWYPVPPSVAGLTNVLPNLKLGRSVDHWFTQIPVSRRPGVARRAALTGVAYVAGRIAGAGFRYPEHTPADLALRVADWAHRQREAGTPALVQCTPSSGVRVCRAAREAGLELAGTIFRFGGEALTAGKAEAVAESGATAGCQYFIEGGQAGIACADPVAPGDVHLTDDAFALLRRPVEGGGGSQPLVLTTVSLEAPKVLLNVEIGDEAVVVERDCGCSTGELGLRRHLHTIRSYELFTSEGMSIRGAELSALVDDVLPGRFGGQATDYQFSEEERGELSRVRLLVSPAVGDIDERAVVETVYRYLAAQGRSEAMMSDVWRGARTLEVVRARPHVTTASKTPPLYRLRG